jgi:hypothetical protein
MKPIKIAPMFMISIMVLAGIGVSYAHWEETLYVEGWMFTDDIDPYFKNAISNDPCIIDDVLDPFELDPWECGYWPVPSAIPADWVGDRKNKDVGCTDIIYLDDAHLGIQVWDAYPCYYSHLYWEVWNRGSVPVNLVSYKLTNLSCYVDYDQDGLIDIDVTIPKNRNLVLGTEYYIKWDEQGNVIIHEGMPAHPENFDFMLMPTGDFAIDDQLDPERWLQDPQPHVVGDVDYMFQVDLCIHFLNGCWEFAIYDFDVEMVFYNWPENCEIEDVVGFLNADLMLCIDISGTIDEIELGQIKTAGHTFLNLIHSDNAITGQVSFETNAHMDRHLTSYEQRCHDALDLLSDTEFRTNLGDGIIFCYNELMAGTYDAGDDALDMSVGDRVPDGEYPDYIIVMTDGAPNEPGGTNPYDYAQAAAENCDAAGIEIFVVGVGIMVQSDMEFLRDDIATTPGHYFGINDYSGLEAALLAIITPP